MIKVIMFTITIVFLTIVRAFVMDYLWEWIIVTTFNLAPLTMASAYGISIFYSFLNLKGNEASNDKSFEDQIVESIVKSIVYAILYLIMGKIAHIFILM